MAARDISSFPIIRGAYPSLTRSEQRISDYIVGHADEVLSQTISDLAAATHSSEITISRYCKKLGFGGLQGLKIALAGVVYTSDESVYQDIHRDDSVETMTRKMFQNITDGLQDTLRLIDFASLGRAIGLLKRAKRIAVYGFGNSATVCRDMETRFLRFGIPVQAYSDAHQQATSASLLTAEDAVVAVSHTGMTVELLRSVDIAHEAGAKVIAITSHGSSELAKKADIVLQGMGRETKYQSESVAYRFVHMAIVDLLYMGLALADPARYSENIHKMRKVIAEKRL